MTSMKIKVKKLNSEASIPSYAKVGDAGLDLTAISVEFERETQCFVYHTGLAFEIPDGHVGLLFPRSSLSKYDLILTNHVGVIDSGFRGEICFKYKTTKKEIDSNIYKKGERVGQLLIVPYPKIELEEVEQLSESERGTSGYGSSGN